MIKKATDSTFAKKSTRSRISPIALFLYNRPEHTIRTMEALRANYLAPDSLLIIFSDGPKTTKDCEKVVKVREYARTLSGFRSVELRESKKNKGLANSIIEGVTEVVNRYGRVVVLEDDIITSPNFLTFMNKALDRYEYEKRIWHISGYNYPIDSRGIEKTFCYRLMDCWGWATWADRWRQFRRDPEFASKQIRKMLGGKFRFNLDGSHNFFRQIELNRTKKIRTWAVFWYATIFVNNGLCVNPSRSLTTNIGFDNTGTHTAKSSLFSTVRDQHCPVLTSSIEENPVAVRRIKRLLWKYRLNVYSRLRGKLGMAARKGKT